MLETGSIAQGQIRLDDRDIRILAILQREGRITKAALAERVHLTPTPCWERLKRLEEAGVIEGYGAQISLRALGPRLTVFVEVFLESHDSEAATHFETAMADFSNIVGCWGVGGGFDYLLKVVSRDLEDYRNVMDAVLEAHIGVTRYNTYVVTTPVKDVPVPVELLAGALT